MRYRIVRTDSNAEVLGYCPVLNTNTKRISNYIVIRYPSTIELCLIPRYSLRDEISPIAIYSPKELFDECNHDPVNYGGIINYYDSL